MPCQCYDPCYLECLRTGSPVHSILCILFQIKSSQSIYCFIEDEEEEEDIHLVPNSADDAPRVTNLGQSSASEAGHLPSRPSGRVVGIIKRNWHS